MTALYIAALAGVFGLGIWAGAHLTAEARRIDQEINDLLTRRDEGLW